MQLNDLKSVVILIGLVAMIGAAVSIALDDFRQGGDDWGSANCNATSTSNCGYMVNITTNGLEGNDNATSYLDTIGTIAGVAVLIGIVVMAFSFIKR